MPDGPRDVDWRIVVFSYNRGALLEHCVASIERHVPVAGRLTIVDDRSDDPATLAALGRLAARHDIVVGGADEELDGRDAPLGSGPRTPAKVGGLYANMRRAFDALPDDTPFSFFQDDVQVVRDVEPEDFEAMRAWFDADPGNAFLHHTFLRGSRRRKIGASLRFDPATSTWSRSAGPEHWGDHFGAILTSRTDRLRGAGWRFADSERENGQRAASRFARAATLHVPFAACLPAVPVHKHRSDTFALRLASRLGREGLYPIRTMTPAEVRALRDRDVARPPWAEDYLATDPPAPTQPWRYGGFQDRRWLKHLHRAEVALRGSGRRGR